MIPGQFSLEQNRPNPFNPATEITFSLPTATDVRLEIYNLLGQRIALLADGACPAGRHSVEWNASQYSSGVYFYRLQAGEFAQTRKMLLIK